MGRHRLRAVLDAACDRQRVAAAQRIVASRWLVARARSVVPVPIDHFAQQAHAPWWGRFAASQSRPCPLMASPRTPSVNRVEVFEDRFPGGAAREQREERQRTRRGDAAPRRFERRVGIVLGARGRARPRSACRGRGGRGEHQRHGEVSAIGARDAAARDRARRRRAEHGLRGLGGDAREALESPAPKLASNAPRQSAGASHPSRCPSSPRARCARSCGSAWGRSSGRRRRASRTARAVLAVAARGREDRDQSRAAARVRRRSRPAASESFTHLPARRRSVRGQRFRPAGSVGRGVAHVAGERIARVVPSRKAGPTSRRPRSAPRASCRARRRPKTRLQLEPPKPNELLITRATGCAARDLVARAQLRIDRARARAAGM
jgi:hypothetical protein